MVSRPDQVVDEDQAADADFVSEQTGAGELGVKGVMRTDPFAGVSLPGINEHPGGVGMALGSVTKQRTLC
jgi:hypothetical protein